MNSSKGHKNWLTVAEIIRLIKEPVALYTRHIIEKLHVKLCGLPLGKCSNPVDCKTKERCRDLCPSCKRWYDELAKFHRKNDKGTFKSMWRQNCDTSKWPNDPWEVAKFYMLVLGDNKTTVKNAESTDLSSLLNVLARLENMVFAPDRRVDDNLVTDLRSKVRNPWAHAPNQESTEDFLNDAFDIAIKFLTDLDVVFSCNEVKKCAEDIKDLKANGLGNVTEESLKSSLHIELIANASLMKEEIELLKEDQSSNSKEIKTHSEKLENLERLLSSLQDFVILQETDRQSEMKSCIFDKPQLFIGRHAIVKQIISSLVENGSGIVSIVGGPGFGKSTLSIEISYRLTSDHNIVVIFSSLSEASTVSEVIRSLCHNVGVNPGDDPESSLMFWLKSIDKKVVLVMDNIEQLLESGVKSQFTQLVLKLRKNSHQRIQILTTTRTKFVIPGHNTENHQLEELTEKSSVELLRKCCPDEKIEDGYWVELAKLCGFVPLALCIAGRRIPGLDDPSELLRWLRETPMEALSNPDQCVQQAIDFSFQKLSDEDKKAFVSLSVFKGNFQRNSAKEIIKKSVPQTQNFLENLVRRSLVQKTNDKRFVIHLLIRRFLADHDQFQEEKVMAQDLMVKHFLEVCNSLTMNCYTLNGFSNAREQLKKDIHNVEETLKICSQDQATNPNILQVLSSSDIYNVSSRFFYNFSWDLLPVKILMNFFESCIKLAESQNQPGIEILFQCLVADQEGRKSAWKSPEYHGRMEAIKAAFREYQAALRDQKSLFLFCHYFLARYDCNKGTSAPATDLLEDVQPLPDNKEVSAIEKAAEAHILMEKGNLSKKHGNKVFHNDKEKYNEHMTNAKLFYNDALSLSKKVLGEHELTCILNKLLGDLFLNLRDNEEALRYYSDAADMRKTLKLDSNEPFVFLLKNCGTCLSLLRRFNESVEKLEEACDIANKLAEKNTLCRALVYYQLAITCSRWKPDCQEAAKYAETAMGMRELLDSRIVKALEKIIEKAEKSGAR